MNESISQSVIFQFIYIDECRAGYMPGKHDPDPGWSHTLLLGLMLRNHKFPEAEIYKESGWGGAGARLHVGVARGGILNFKVNKGKLQRGDFNL